MLIYGLSINGHLSEQSDREEFVRFLGEECTAALDLLASRKPGYKVLLDCNSCGASAGYIVADEEVVSQDLELQNELYGKGRDIISDMSSSE